MAERALTPPAGVRSSEAQTFRFGGSIVPVAIHPQMPSLPARPDDVVFNVDAPSGQRLLTAVIVGEDLMFARQRWQRAVLSLSLVAVAGRPVAQAILAQFPPAAAAH